MKERIEKEAVRVIARKAGPVSVLCESACYGGRVMEADEIATNLQEAGYTVEYEDLKNGSWCRLKLPNPKFVANPDGIKEGDKLLIFEPTILVGQGYSSDRESALKHAVMGACREEDARKAVGEAIESKGVKVDEKLRGQLEHRYIMAFEKGDTQLAEDMKAFDRSK